MSLLHLSGLFFQRSGVKDHLWKVFSWGSGSHSPLQYLVVHKDQYCPVPQLNCLNVKLWYLVLQSWKYLFLLHSQLYFQSVNICMLNKLSAFFFLKKTEWTAWIKFLNFLSDALQTRSGVSVPCWNVSREQGNSILAVVWTTSEFFLCTQKKLNPCSAWYWHASPLCCTLRLQLTLCHYCPQNSFTSQNDLCQVCNSSL